MNNYNLNTMSDQAIQQAQVDFVSKAYAWMTGGLLTTGTTAWYVFESGLWEGLVGSMLILGLLSLGLVWFLSARIDTLSKNAATGIFIGYAALLGVTLSPIFAVYTMSSIYQVFFITAGMFGAMAVYGFTTKKDLSGLGRFMFMGLIGIILASIANWFIASPAFSMTIAVIGVVVFAGLAAYDTQKIKEMWAIQFEGNEIATKGAIMGGLALYLDFINLFLFLLRLLGNRD